MKFSHRFITTALVCSLLASVCLSPLPVQARKQTAAEKAAAEQAEAERQAVYNKSIDSNQIENWPQGPQIYAESAIVMEASTGTILYNKDMDMVNYPASITKVMTALLTLEHCSLDEIVTYSYYATHSIEAGSSSIGTTENEQLTVEESLYGLMLESANECGNGLAEHVAGSIEEFVNMMNEKAAELGCTNTHFVNPHGLPDDNHYTTAHDMALIMQAALKYENFARISGTATYDMRATNMDDEITYMKNHHYMINTYKGVSRFLDDTVIAGKTGFTTIAKNTLVTAAERNGMTLIVVTMRTASTNEKGVPLYTDTALLLDYASENFNKVNVASHETNFSVDNSNIFHTGSNIFGQAQPLISINENDGIILPNNVDFSEASPDLSFQNEEGSDIIATLSYTYQGQPVGSASIQLAEENVQEFTFDKETGSDGTAANADPEENTEVKEPKKFIKINIRLILTVLIIAAVVFALYLLLKVLMKSFQISISLPRRRRRRRNRRRHSLVRRRRQKKDSRYHRKPKQRRSSYSDLDL